MRIFWNATDRRLRAFWRLLIQSTAWFGLQLIFGTLLAVAVIAVTYFSSSSAPAGLQPLMDQLNQPGVLLILEVLDIGIVLLTVWLAGRFLDRRRFADFGFHFSARWFLDLAFGLFLGGLLMAGIYLIESAAGWLEVSARFKSLLDGTAFPLAILLPVVFFICVGIAEELSSRGYQLKNIAEGLNVPALGGKGAILLATVLSSILFGLLHGANPNITGIALLNLMAAGVFLALGYLLTGELALPIGIHIAWNFFQGNVFGFPVSGIAPIGAQFLTIRQGGPDFVTGGAFGPEGGLIGLGAMVGGSLLIVLWTAVTRGRVGLVDRIAESPQAEPAGTVEKAV
jgi:uncharacterized protein